MGGNNNKAGGGGSLESKVSAITTKDDVRRILQIDDRWLNADELQLVYNGVFPRITNPTRWDIRLQRREAMPKAAVAEELCQDMQETYDFLVREINFLDAGARPHNSYQDLTRHLWDSAYRGRIMDLPLETKQILLMHSLPEYRARGLEEARAILAQLGKEFGSNIADIINAGTFWDGILIDHLAHTMKRVGGKLSENGEHLYRRLNKISKAGERAGVTRTLGELDKLSVDSSKRLVPVDIAGGDYLFPEARARLHIVHVKDMYDASHAAVESHYGNRKTYNNPILLVEALCLTDKLRTADDRVQVERVTREAMDFLPYLDRMVGFLQNSELVNNPLAFVNATLKTELLSELEQRTSQARSRRDTTFASFADLLESRLITAGRLYGSVAEQMGHKSVYNPSRMH